jgi:hypothetical protein
MKLQVPFVQLPLLFDADALASEVASVAESEWKPHPQGFPGNSMLPLMAVDGNPANEGFAGRMRPTPNLQSLPYLSQVFASLGATIGRSRLMRLSGNAEVTRHADQGYYWADRVRVHVPIRTQPTVRFECDGEVVNMAPGECWIFDTWRQHSVRNDATLARIHLVVDTVGGAGFWNLVGAGRGHRTPREGWNTRFVPPRGGEVARFPCESVNVPSVMSPWELSGHLDLLFADAKPHANLGAVRIITMRFLRAWQGLWFEHGDAEDARPRFRALLQSYQSEVAAPAQPLQLKNDLHWLGAVAIMIGKSAVAGGLASQRSAAAHSEVGDNA